MSETTITIRAKSEILDRATRLAPRLGEDPHYGALAPSEGLSRASVLRLALVLGLEELERRYPQKATP